MREPESLLLLSMAGSRRGSLELTAAVKERLRSSRPLDAAPGRKQIEAALVRAGGNVTKAFRALGLTIRDALNRLIRKHGIEVARRGRRS